MNALGLRGLAHRLGLLRCFQRLSVWVIWVTVVLLLYMLYIHLVLLPYIKMFLTTD